MMNPQIILNDGQTAVCRCPTSRERTNLGSMTSMMSPSGRGSAAALAAGKNMHLMRPTSMEMLTLDYGSSVAPRDMMRLSSGRTALRRQTSAGPTIDEKDKILAWIQSKSAYGSKHTVGGAAELEQQMKTDFMEWRDKFCSGDGKFILEKEKLIKFTDDRDTFVLTPADRRMYCEILNEQLDPDKRETDETEHSQSPFMYCGFPPFPPLFPKGKTSSGEQKSGQKRKPAAEEQEKRYVLIRARDAYREWWIDKYTTIKHKGEINEKTEMQDTLKEYWDLLAQQRVGQNTFDDFFLFEDKIDKAIQVLKGQPAVTLKDLVKLERKTSVDSLLTLLKKLDKKKGKKKQGGYKKRKSKKRARNKRGGRKSRRKRLRRKTKKRKRKTNRKKRKTKRRR